jgi:anti-sigma B factor antagonist
MTMFGNRPVIVMQLPEVLNEAEAQAFLTDVQPLLEVDRPRIVLDCSQIQHMDSAGVEMLLRCLEEAMKRDGDLKLAAVPPASAVILDLMRVDGLFQTFQTTEEASLSFDAFALPHTSHHPGTYSLDHLKAAS